MQTKKAEKLNAKAAGRRVERSGVKAFVDRAKVFAADAESATGTPGLMRRSGF